MVCENAGIEPVIVVNKGDLLDAEQEQEVESQLQIYRDIGYQTIIISAETGKNMEKLTALLSDGTSIFVGQSGVGKSSLINHILPTVNAQVGGIRLETGAKCSWSY